MQTYTASSTRTTTRTSVVGITAGLEARANGDAVDGETI